MFDCIFLAWQFARRVFCIGLGFKNQILRLFLTLSPLCSSSGLFVCLFLACPVDILHWIGVQTGFCSVTVQSQDFSWLCPSCCSRGLITNQGSFVTRQGGRLRPSWHRRHNSILVFQLVLAFWLFGHPWPCWQNHHNFVPFKLQSSDQ